MAESSAAPRAGSADARCAAAIAASRPCRGSGRHERGTCARTRPRAGAAATGTLRPRGHARGTARPARRARRRALAATRAGRQRSHRPPRRGAIWRTARCRASGTSAAWSGSAPRDQFGLIGDLNNICQPSLPDPEPASGHRLRMVRPPRRGRPACTGRLYDEYGIAGQSWAATNLQCSDMTSLIGNNVASMVFDAAKSIDRVTITVYQSAAGEGMLGWLQNALTDQLITQPRQRDLLPVPGRGRDPRRDLAGLAGPDPQARRPARIEGTIWMVVACAAAIWLIGRPADFTGIGQDGVRRHHARRSTSPSAGCPVPGRAAASRCSKGDPQVTGEHLHLHRGQRGRRPERRRALGRAGVQAMAGRRVRHDPAGAPGAADRRSTRTAARCSGRRPSP